MIWPYRADLTLSQPVDALVAASETRRRASNNVLSRPMARFIEVKVKPGAPASVLRQDEAGAWLAQLRSPPSGGKANAELVELVARHFGCRKSDVSIRRGASSRLKLVRIDSP